MVITLLGFVVLQVAQHVQRIKLEHIAPEEIMRILRVGQGGNPLPEGLQVIVDPTDNSMIVRGTEDKIAEFKQLVSRFDVEAVRLRVKIQATWPLLKKERSSEAMIYNGELWTVGDKDSGFYVYARPVYVSPKKLSVDVEVHDGSDVAVFSSADDPKMAIVFNGFEAWTTPIGTDLSALLDKPRGKRPALARKDALRHVGANVALSFEAVPSMPEK